MKKLLLLTIIFFVSASVILPQWTKLTSPTTSVIRYLKAVNEQVLWACGYAGVVIKSTDGGNTWNATTVTDATFDNLSMDAIDANTAWVTGTVGSNVDAAIWKTTDGGATWVQQWRDPLTFSDGIKFFDANNGVAYFDPSPANEWIVLTTSNGGTTWNKVAQQNLPPADGANSEYGLATAMFTYGNNVWFTAYSNVDSRVYYSTDRGLTWGKSPALITTASSGSLFIAPLSATKLVALGGDGWPGYSEDGGKTWNFPSTTSIGVACRSLALVPGTNSLLAVGTGGKSMISRDGGLTWTAIPTTVEAKNLRSVAVLSPTLAFVVGDAGNIYKWTGENLPVELTSFTAKSLAGKVYLEWSTATEINNKGFEIERKEDSGNWRVIGYKQGNGTKADVSKYTYADDISKLNVKSISYRLKQIDFDGTFTYSSEQSIDASTPSDFIVNQNYPNPFNPTTSIEYGLPFESNVNVLVYDALGQVVSELVNQVQAAGYHEVSWNAGNTSTGTYFYVIKAFPLNGGNEFTSIKKMMLVK